MYPVPEQPKQEARGKRQDKDKSPLAPLCPRQRRVRLWRKRGEGGDFSCFLFPAFAEASTGRPVSCFLFQTLTLFLLFGFFANCGGAPKKPPVPVTLLNPHTADEMKKEKGYWIEVQVPQRKLVLAKGDHIIKTFPVAVGMPSYPSPIGKKAINRMVWNPWWHPPKGSDWVEDTASVPPRDPKNPLGEIKMPLGKSYLIHGTRAVQSIGQWASHGCIRMLFEDLFGLVQLLMTEYSKTSAIEAMEKANKTPHTEFETRLNREVPVVFNYDLVTIYDGYILIAPDLYNKQKDFAAFIAETIKPHLKKKQEPHTKKIRELLRVFKNQTVMVPIQNLALNP